MKQCGIKVMTEARATKVTDKTISIFDKASKTTQEFPCGLVVWATGVEPGRFIKTFMSKLPDQRSYRSLKTDSHCQVLGAPGVYAIGDCADIDLQAEYEYKISKLFHEIHESFPLGRPKEQRLSREGHAQLVDRLKQLSEQIVSAPMAKIYQAVLDHYQDSQENQSNVGISSDELMSLVRKHMQRQKVLPPTAQVAHQQGEYLAKLLNHPHIDPATNDWTYDHGPAFDFSNKGQLVYVGGHMAALSVPARQDIEMSWNGSMTNYLWHAAYFGMLESTALWRWFEGCGLSRWNESQGG